MQGASCPGEPADGLLTVPELEQRILHQGEGLLVVNKPGWLVCHPSKRGPWSSLVGAAREYLGVESVHPAARLDRETSGVVVLATNREADSRVQRAVEQGKVCKRYLAVLSGVLREGRRVVAPLGPAKDSPVAVKRQVVPEGEGQAAETRFHPLGTGGGWTLCEVELLTGRQHQIRVHAAHIGHPLAGDKLYGPDETLYLELCAQGWTARHARELPLGRQALHCAEMDFRGMDEGWFFRAPLERDMADFITRQMGLTAP